MNRFCILMAAAAWFLITDAYAVTWEPVVLKATSIRQGSGGMLVITLSSGSVIKVPSGDRSISWTKAVEEGIRKEQSDSAVRSTSSPPSDAAAAAMIRSKCARDWPENFRMRKYCEDQQYQGLRALRSRSMTGSTMRMIRSKCARDWPENFRMRNFCENQQLNALRELNR